MTFAAASTFLALPNAYREDAVTGGALGKTARSHLGVASDALTLALLTLGGQDGKARRAEQARGFLVEAVTALSRARVFVPKIRSHAVAVVMDTNGNPDAELARLHQIATRLLWQNHAHLPARRQAEPLAPEEEAQLAFVLARLSRHAKIERAMRYKWAGLAVVMAAVGPLLGFALLGAIAASTAIALVLWRVAADQPAAEEGA